MSRNLTFPTFSFNIFIVVFHQTNKQKRNSVKLISNFVMTINQTSHISQTNKYLTLAFLIPEYIFALFEPSPRVKSSS